MTKLSIEDVETAYDQHFDDIYRFFSYKLIDKSIAEDLTSETFMVFVKHVKNNLEIVNIKQYLYGIARNIFLKYLKQKYDERAVSYDKYEDFIGYVENYIKTESKLTLEEKLKKYLDKLPEKQALIIRMRLIDKLTLNEIAEKVGHDINYVKTTQKRGIKRLRELIACTP